MSHPFDNEALASGTTDRDVDGRLAKVLEHKGTAQ